MRHGPRPPFDHMKTIYGENLEKYSYQEVKRDSGVNFREMEQRGKYESIREKVIEYVMLAFAFFMAAIGISFLLTSIISS